MPTPDPFAPPPSPGTSPVTPPPTVDEPNPVAAVSTVTGTGVNELFVNSALAQVIDGGAGVDTVAYTGLRASFSLSRVGNGFVLADNTGALGTDTLQNIERMKFSDGGIALDVGATQSAGQTQLLLGAVLGRELLATKEALIGTGIDLFDQGYTLQQLSGAVMRLPIWDVLTGKATPTNTDIALYLLTRVNGVAPDTTVLANAVAALDVQTDIDHGQGDFLWHLAESSANQTQVDLVGLAKTGLLFGV